MAVKEVVSGRLVGAAEACVGHVVIGFTLLQGTRLENRTITGNINKHQSKSQEDINYEIFMEILKVIKI